MDIEQSEGPDGLELKLKGNLTKECVPALKDAVSRYAGEHGDLLLDMSEVSYIDSSGLGALIFAHKTSLRRGGALILVNMSPMVTKFLQATGLLAHFQHETRPEGA